MWGLTFEPLCLRRPACQVVRTDLFAQVPPGMRKMNLSLLDRDIEARAFKAFEQVRHRRSLSSLQPIPAPPRTRTPLHASASCSGGTRLCCFRHGVC